MAGEQIQRSRGEGGRRYEKERDGQREADQDPVPFPAPEWRGGAPARRGALLLVGVGAPGTRDRRGEDGAPLGRGRRRTAAGGIGAPAAFMATGRGLEAAAGSSCLTAGPWRSSSPPDRTGRRRQQGDGV